MRGRAPPSHPEGPQEPDRKQPQERQQQQPPQPQPSGSRLRAAGKPPPTHTRKSESEKGGLELSGPSLSVTPTFYLPALPRVFSRFLFISAQFPALSARFSSGLHAQ